MEELEGYIERIVYRNEENGYTVFTLTGDGADADEQTCVGSFPFINEGEYVSLMGSFTEHALYGRQLQVSSYTPSSPKSAKAMERYLASGAIKGVGAALAARIVGRFGADTFDIIDNEPERLAEIKGISENKAREIYKQFEEKREVRDTMLYLQQFGISTTFAVKIYNHYGSRTREVIAENPYRLAEDIKGIGFKFADDLAMRMGYSDNSDFRLRAGIIYTLSQGSSAGHSYLPEEVLRRHAQTTLGVAIPEFDNVLDELSMERKLVIKLDPESGERRIYLNPYYYCELGIARQLLDLDIKEEFNEAAVNRRLQMVEDKLSIELDEMQLGALKEALTGTLLIITGGPGTGKTTTINAMIEMFRQEGQSVMLAAPTGRAAKRMSEATGEEARTIHRMLEFMPSGELGDSDSNRLSFQKNEENPLEADVLIIDEASMIDMFLMNSLLKAVTVGTRIIFSGDFRQLPSVGAGNVLHDMIESGCFRVVRLNRIFRQAKESDIIVNAHKIDKGEHPVFDNKSRDFFMMRRPDVKSVTGTMIQLVKDKLPPYVNAASTEIQILTPMRAGELGAHRLNEILQESLNPPDGKKREKEYLGVTYREGDKVMQVKNDYQLEWRSLNRFGMATESGMGVFNGDIGVIKEINLFAELVTVVFDDNREVEYGFNLLDELMHAYAVTVHKSQGSEYPAVVLPVLGGPRQLLNRNLLYTAITRASRCVVIIGSENTVIQMIDNEDENKRFTGLKDAIRDMAAI